MLDGWTLSNIGDLGGTGFAAIIFVLVLWGKLIPRRNLQDAKDESNQWRRAWELSESARSEEARQTKQMLDGLQVNTKLLEALRLAAYTKETRPRDMEHPS